KKALPIVIDRAFLQYSNGSESNLNVHNHGPRIHTV
ncbi:MAG: hypothetical protein ACJA2S_003663, partial [Cyclobacteriaceae bacterium]